MRYVMIDGPRRTFSYKNFESDETEKLVVDLSTARVTKALRNGYQPVVEIYINGKTNV